ncbi:hypothetical protein DFQ29_001079, partial [Apophysomyces sp. BC1021]
MFYAIFDFNKLRYKSLEELTDSSEERGTIFTNQIASDGFAIDFQFARKSKKKEMVTVDTELLPSNFTVEEINDYFKPCAVDPGRSQVPNTGVVYIHGVATTTKKLEAEKKESGIDNTEAKLETRKTQNIEAY